MTAEPSDATLSADEILDDPLVIVHEVTKRWPRMDAPVLDEVSLDFGRGQSSWLSGRNGVGKTTLLRILSGQILPGTGFVELDGLSPERERKEYQRRIALLTAGDAGLYARLTVRQHLRFWARLALLPRAEREDAVEWAIARFALEQLVDRRVDRMSMGQRQRLRLGMTFMHRPLFVLLDEPLNSLDDEGAAVLAGGIEEVLARGGSCLWVSPKGDERSSGLPVHRRLRLEHGRLEAS